MDDKIDRILMLVIIVLGGVTAALAISLLVLMGGLVIQMLHGVC